jgi:hypothetical protein
MLQTKLSPGEGAGVQRYFEVLGGCQFVGMLGSGSLGDVVGVMIINTMKVDLLAGRGCRFRSI